MKENHDQDRRQSQDRTHKALKNRINENQMNRNRNASEITTQIKTEY